MSFDFSTLITDRTQKDVDGKTAKGFYNASDLNRVTACMEYLDEELRKLGYESGYKPVVVHPQEEGGSRLPDGYTELEYIESTGTQWIDTGRKPTQDSAVELKFQITLTDEKTYAVCGSRNVSTGATGAFGLFKINSSSFSAYIGNQVKSVSKPANDQHVLLMTGTSVSIDGSKSPVTASNFTGNYTFLICAMNQLNGVDSRRASMKIWYAKGTIGTEFDMIPCKDPNGAVGLYDMVGKVFYGSSGSGQFLAGPEIVPEPEPEPLDPYTWYKEDNPTISQMEQYLSNVAALRSVFELPEYAPQTPQSMALLTFAKANDIERVLQYVETTIQQTVKGMARSNSFTFWSGNRPFPTAESNKGRNWAELDAMETEWRNWQVATWYLLLYGNLKAEGDVS